METLSTILTAVIGSIIVAGAICGIFAFAVLAKLGHELGKGEKSRNAE